MIYLAVFTASLWGQLRAVPVDLMERFVETELRCLESFEEMTIEQRLQQREKIAASWPVEDQQQRLLAKIDRLNAAEENS